MQSVKIHKNLTLKKLLKNIKCNQAQKNKKIQRFVDI